MKKFYIIFGGLVVALFAMGQSSGPVEIRRGGGGGSGVPTLNGTATNLQVYSSGTTNRPLRVFGTNGTSEVYVDKDGYLGSTSSGNYNQAAIFLSGGNGFSLYQGQLFSVIPSGPLGYGPALSGTGLGLYSSHTAWWGPSGDLRESSKDTAVGRLSSGVIEITTGTSGAFRDLVARSIYATNASITNITADSYITTQQTLAYASGTNVTVDANKSLHFVSLTNTAYLAQPSNLGVGRSFSIILQQDGTGTRAVTFNTNYWKFPGGVVPTITTNANAYDVLSCISCPYGTNVFVVHNANFR